MKICMRLNSLLCTLYCVEGVFGRHGLLLARQVEQDITSTTNEASSTSSSIQTSATSSALQRSSSTSNVQTSAADLILTTSTSSISSASSSTTSTLNATSPGATALPGTQGDALPLQPRVTPALGVAGFVLIVAGVALTLIGIKHKWIHVFLSTAFLSGLAVTVLIIYVMNPPVSDAIQGAYLVAIMVTGLILGAVSIVFIDVTEGLGCLLGGFCLAMWFLVLRSGGLIQSTVGCAIFIACLAVAGFCLSFSRYTRNYGLIACTSFAGATITIIGIDCFSRAGLKEFWVYIWNLNDDEFPLGTTTYPITRGIRVEIAGIIIICLFGLLSQLKIWKIVKERRARMDAEQAQLDENNHQVEAAIGKSLETSNERELAHWESVYGDKNGHRVSHGQVDSAVGSSINTDEKRSSVREREVDAIELADVPRTHSKRDSRVSLRRSLSKRFSSLEAGPKSPSWAAPSQENLIEERLKHDSDHRKSASHASTYSVAPSHMSAVGPAIIPLPFTLPEEKEDDQDVASDGASVDVARSVNDRRGIPLSRLSLASNKEAYPSHLPKIAHERTYSLAATADDAPDIDLLSNPRWSTYPSAEPSPNQEAFDKNALLPSSLSSPDPRRLSRQTIGEAPVEENDEEALVRPSGVREIVPAMPSVVSSEVPKITTPKSFTDQQDDTASVVVGSLHEQHLPQGLSKVAQTYRTNEWAKHIVDAEEPEADNGVEYGSPSIRIDPAFAEEAARPVQVDILTASPIAQDQLSQRASHSSSKAFRTGLQQSKPTRTPSGSTAVPVYASERGTSQFSVSKQSANVVEERSASALSSRGPPTPTSTAPDRVASPAATSRNPSSPMGVAPSTNLMDQREDRLKHKPTTTSFIGRSVTPNSQVITPVDTAVGANAVTQSPTQNVEDEMTLAVRRAMMQQQQQRPESRQQQQQPTSSTFQARSASQTRSASRTRRDSQSRPGPQSRSNSQTRMNEPRSESRTSRRNSKTQGPSSRRNSSVRPGSRRGSASQPLTTASQNMIYDSHQPKRTNTIDSQRQSERLTQWRQSLDQDGSNRPQAFTATVQIGAGLSEMQRQVEARREFLDREREKREAKREELMRAGAMHDLHRDKLRKMQAKATADAEKK